MMSRIVMFSMEIGTQSYYLTLTVYDMASPTRTTLIPSLTIDPSRRI
jgi:hypothetical protein